MRTSVQLFLSLSGIFLLSSLSAQVVINEISYNPPESGVDSLEYIELFNAGNQVVHIGGWYFSAGIEDTLPDVDLQAGDYFVTAISAQAMMNVFGISVHQWKGGALNNNGELLTLVDQFGNEVSSVLFDDSDPWPTEPDGNGPSLELKDPFLDLNDGASWQASGGSTGVIINGVEVFGTPGAQNSGGGNPGADLTINLAHLAFHPSIAVIKVGDVVRWVNNENDFHNVNGTTGTYPDNPEGFLSGGPALGPWEYEFEFTIPGTYHYQCDPHVLQGMTGIIYVYDPLQYTDFPLSALRLVNDNGVALFDGVPTRITGVVHGVNFQPSGYSFYVINSANMGINVFAFTPLAYTVTEGDALRVSGTIDQFNGLLEIIPDDIEVLSTGVPLVSPRELFEVTEEDEGSYVYAHSLHVDSVSNVSAGGFTIYTTFLGEYTILIRVDADANIGLGSDDFHPGAWIGVTGIGTQFDNSFPYTSGYQILALYIYILIDGIELLDNSAIQMFPNPTSGDFRLISDLTMHSATLYTLDGKIIAHDQVQEAEHMMKFKDIPAGMYMVRVVTEEGVWLSRLMVQQP